MAMSHIYKNNNRNGSVAKPVLLNGTCHMKSRKWVLIMDDDAIMRQVMCSMLEAVGYRAYATKNGEEAVWSYEKAKECGYAFDAVILDLNVPMGKGGKETMRELRAMDPEVRAIVSSGDVTDPAMMDHRSFGFRGVLGKPFTLDQLLQTLQMATDGTGCVHEEYTAG